LTIVEAIVPSGSVAEKVRVTCWFVRAGFGETPVTLAVGGLSFMATELAAEPVEPLLSVAIVVMVKVWDLALPVVE
jgi:hypothetical protein